MSVKLSLPAQYDDVRINPTWRTAAILKVVISPYLSRESSEYDEIWYAYANFDPIDRNVRKTSNTRAQFVKIVLCYFSGT